MKYIYKIKDNIHNKYYVGQHISTKKTDSYMGSGILIKAKLKKYGKINFTKEIVEYCENQYMLNKREIYYIKKFQSKWPNGYNLTDGGGGNSGWIVSDETKEKIRNSHLGKKHNKDFCERRSELTIGENNPNYGKKLSDETKEKIRNSVLGFKHTEETKKKISNIHKGRKFSEEHKKNLSESHKKVDKSYMIGRKHTEETKKKISDAHKGRKFSEEHKKNLSKSHLRIKNNIN